MKHYNKVNKLSKSYEHRKAMFSNMVTSLFEHERIVTTKPKAKELKIISEKMITRAKENITLGEAEGAKKLHNKRIIMRSIKNRDVVAKLFDDIAVRNKDRNGGYTRMYLLAGARPGDATEEVIIELVERKAESAAPKAAKEKAKKDKPAKSEKADKTEKK